MGFTKGAALGAITLAAAALTPGAFADNSGWTLLDIGTLGGPGSYATAVSDEGVVVGCSDVAGGAIHAFVYRQGTLIDLAQKSGLTEGDTCALAVNSAGLVAGRSSTRGLLLWKGSSSIALGVQGNIGGINDASDVVGAYAAAAQQRAFVYRNGQVIELGALAAGDSMAYAINERDEIVGSSGGRPFLYANGSMRDLGTLGGNAGAARGINDRGQVVGMAADANGQPTPFLYDNSMSAIPGTSDAAAIAINNKGQVIASAEGTYGWLLDNGTATRLDTLPAVRAKGWRHMEPTAINARGWIVGSAMTAEGDTRAFILVPNASFSLKRNPD
jgi:probable HAF family extracellular repeat protein